MIMETRSRDQHCKIRKRGNSSSSSSSLVHTYKFKRAVVVAKRGVGSTKSPTLSTPIVESATCESHNDRPCGGGGEVGKGKDFSVSARKLAATLWEINQITSTNRVDNEEKKQNRSKDRVVSLTHLLDPSHTPVSERMDRSGGNGRRRASVVTKKLQHSEHHSVGDFDSVNYISLVEMETPANGKGQTKHATGIKTCLEDVSNGLTTSKELVKVIHRMWGLDGENSSGTSLLLALRIELDRVRTQVNQLIQEERFRRNELECLVKYFEEEKAAWRSKEREKIHNAIASIQNELQAEKKLRRQTERLNKKLGLELADTKASFTNAMKELESEKRAKEVLEQVCDELARGIGEDRAAVEELKKESAMVKEEVAKEREMLQLADILREGRVQMKLSEAQYHFEEKNAVVEKLKGELETYVRNKAGEASTDCSPDYEKIKELEAYLRKIKFGSDQKAHMDKHDESDTINGEVHDFDDSAESELHSIDLNMDDNNESYQRCYAWEGNSKMQWIQSPGKAANARKSSSEKIRNGCNFVQANYSNDVDVTHEGCSQSPEVFDAEMSLEHGYPSLTRNQEFNTARYESVKSLKDHIVSESKQASMQNMSSPNRRWGQCLSFQDLGCAIFKCSPILQEVNLKPRVVETRGGQQIPTSSRQ